MTLAPGFGLYLAISTKSFKVKSKSLALKCRLWHKRLMNNWMETIALPPSATRCQHRHSHPRGENERHNSSTWSANCWSMGIFKATFSFSTPDLETENAVETICY